MPFCPTCRAEYGDATKSCDICGEALVDSLPQITESVADGLELVEVAQFSNVSEAEMIKEIFEENGIPTVQKGEVDPIGVASGAEPITLLVEEKFLQQARDLYEAFFAGNELETTPSDQE